MSRRRLPSRSWCPRARTSAAGRHASSGSRYAAAGPLPLAALIAHPLFLRHAQVGSFTCSELAAFSCPCDGCCALDPPPPPSPPAPPPPPFFTPDAWVNWRATALVAALIPTGLLLVWLATRACCKRRYGKRARRAGGGIGGIGAGFMRMLGRDGDDGAVEMEEGGVDGTPEKDGERCAAPPRRPRRARSLYMRPHDASP